MSYYQRIRDLREDEDMTQDKIAKKLGMHKTQYCRYEKGDCAVPFEFIIKLSDFYKVSIDYIAGLTNDKGGLHKNDKEEQEVLTLYHNLSYRDKCKIIGRMEEMIDRKNETKNKISIKQGDNNKTTFNINNK